MKKLLALILAVALFITAFAACGEKEEKIYDYNLDEYVSLGKYLGIEIDTKSETFLNYYKSQYEADINSAGATEQLKEGTCQKGDLVNITYSGKKDADGTIFTGDTSAENNDGKESYDLNLGSGEFITGFEDQLIGKKVGSTVYVKVTFPSDYQEESMRSVAATFTVTINYINAIPELTDAVAVKLGYNDKAAYEADLADYIKQTMILDAILSASDFAIIKYPETEKARYDTMYNDYIAYAEEQAKTYNSQYGTAIDAATMLYYLTGMDQTGLRSYCDEALKLEMIMYSIFRKENLSFTQEEYDIFVKNLANSQNTTVEEIQKQGKATIEPQLVRQIVIEYLLGKAVIK